MKRFFAWALALILLCALGCMPAFAELEAYWGPYTGGLHVDYDPALFELEDTFEENGEVRFTCKEKTPVPVTFQITCYPDSDQADVDFQVTGPYGLEGHDAVIGNNYYDAMSYYYPTDVDGVEQRRYVYILSCMEDVFVIDMFEYDGIPQEIGEAMNAMLDSFEFGGA